MEKKHSLDHVDDSSCEISVDNQARPTEGAETKIAKEIEDAYNWDQTPFEQTTDYTDPVNIPVSDIDPRSIYWNWQFLIVFVVNITLS